MYSETVWHERIETIVCFIKASKKYFPIFGSEITRYANVFYCHPSYSLAYYNEKNERRREHCEKESRRRPRERWRKKRRRLLAQLNYGVSPALRIMPRNADNWPNRPGDPRRRAHRCSWRRGTAKRSSARDPSCLIDSKWFILSAVPLHLRHSSRIVAIIKMLRWIVVQRNISRHRSNSSPWSIYSI